jgi:glycosyltransferase involved in cell wall biosynthesis
MYERKMIPAFDRTLTVTEQDRTLLNWLTGSRTVSYLPRGVDMGSSVDEYSSREPMSVLFVGSFSHQPNRDAALFLAGEVFPLVLVRFPKAKLDVVGGSPPQELIALAARESRIHVRGFVDDVDACFRRAAVFVAPLRFGGGVKVKILHAMSHGIPVVTTKVGIEGIEGAGPENVLVADSAARLADHVCSLFENVSAAEALGKAGRELVRERFSWSSVTQKLEQIYLETLA